MNFKAVYKFTLALLLLIAGFAQTALAQDNTVEMADVMRSNGKIYVVVAVLATVLAGLIAYLFMLDTRLTRLEKQNKSTASNVK